MLRDLVAGGMAQLEAVVEQASRVDEDAVAARPLGTPAPSAAPPLISAKRALGSSTAVERIGTGSIVSADYISCSWSAFWKTAFVEFAKAPSRKT